LPWDHVDAGVTKEFLAAEYAKAREGLPSPPCESAACRRCGACGDGVTVSQAGATLPEPGPRAAAPRTERAQRLRFTYGKTGRWRWLSHLELYRLVLGQLRRAGVPVSWSGGYSPKSRLVLAPALPVGVAAVAEFGDVVLREEVDAEDFVARVNEKGPFAVAAARDLALDADALEVSIRGARYRVEFAPMAAARGVPAEKSAAAVEGRLKEPDLKVATRRGERDLTGEVEVRSWDAASGVLELDVAAAATGAVFDVAAHLAGASSRESRAARVTRTRVFLRGAATPDG
jgi:radical SAM-linked protein